MKRILSLPAHGIRPQRAFTILEMVVVLAIIGMLLGVIINRVGNTLGRSEVSIARIFVRDSISLPLTNYRIDFGDYPSTSEGLAALVSAPGAGAEKWRGPYLDVTGGKLPTDPWGQPYEYRYPGVKNPGKYDLYSKGPDKTADTADDIGNW